MNTCRLFAPALFFAFAFAASAHTVEIPAGGFSLQTAAEPTLTDRTASPHAPPNALFPRIRTGKLSLDAVTWNESKNEKPLSTVLAERSRAARFSVFDARAFTTESGLTGIRFVAGPKGAAKTIPLHRFIFRNREKAVICVGALGDASALDALFRSAALLP